MSQEYKLIMSLDKTIFLVQKKKTSVMDSIKNLILTLILGKGNFPEFCSWIDFSHSFYDYQKENQEDRIELTFYFKEDSK
jgi:hypothetical protein